MKKFEVGKVYEMRSPCDSECVWRYGVVARTAATVTLFDGRAAIKRRINKSISECRGAESVMPLGNYSMAPILSADLNG